jgi:hypothetical protein
VEADHGGTGEPSPVLRREAAVEKEMTEIRDGVRLYKHSRRWQGATRELRVMLRPLWTPGAVVGQPFVRHGGKPVILISPCGAQNKPLHQSSVSLRRHRRAVWGDGLGVRVLRARRAVIIFRNERLTIEGQHLLVRGRREGRGRVDYYLM